MEIDKLSEELAVIEEEIERAKNNIRVNTIKLEDLDKRRRKIHSMIRIFDNGSRAISVLDEAKSKKTLKDIKSEIDKAISLLEIKE